MENPALLRHRTSRHRHQLHSERRRRPQSRARNVQAHVRIAMSHRVGETFDAIVTGVTPKGTFVA